MTRFSACAEHCKFTVRWTVCTVVVCVCVCVCVCVYFFKILLHTAWCRVLLEKLNCWISLNFIEPIYSISVFTRAYGLYVSEGWMIFQVAPPRHFCYPTSADSMSKLTLPVRCDCFSVNLMDMESVLTSIIHFTFCRSVMGDYSGSQFCHIKSCRT